jgi:hypothetical protein
VKAIVEAFRAGLEFDPPAISSSEYRQELRDKAGWILDDPDVLDPPRFSFPEDDYTTDEENDEHDTAA